MIVNLSAKCKKCIISLNYHINTLIPSSQVTCHPAQVGSDRIFEEAASKAHEVNCPYMLSLNCFCGQKNEETKEKGQ